MGMINAAESPVYSLLLAIFSVLFSAYHQQLRLVAQYLWNIVTSYEKVGIEIIFVSLIVLFFFVITLFSAKHNGY